MSTPAYPITLDVRGRRVLVVGAGPVAERRVRALLASGARVDVIAPRATEGVRHLAEDDAVTWHQRAFDPADLTAPARAWLVHTATGRDEVDQHVCESAAAEAIWSVRAGDSTRSAAWMPAVGAGRGDADGIQVAVTGGGDPRRSTALRDAILIAMETGELPVARHRHPAQAPVEMSIGPRRDLDSAPSTEQSAGRVVLVGGGPGADDLITVRGRRLLTQADVVVTDRLGATGLLDQLPQRTKIIDVGKTPGHHPVPQWEINEILVREAKEGQLVVRLKGGDPFVLGRGGEEMLHCAAHGIPVDVVPGVTSAISVPAAAGIPVTQRGITASFVMASAHEGPEHVLAAARSAAPDATLVLLMGVSHLDETARGLMAAGRSPQTPVAIIESGWTERQRTTTTTLESAAADARAAGVRPPAVVVIGEVVGVREELLALEALPG
ncbi:MAG TPA: uroporphyrinogen-III C-methyltransferase [Tetrasphaera sp.]|nr:uroporphyrinogen-III C-methyltransferase [Tetrasphaera sp.]